MTDPDRYEPVLSKPTRQRPNSVGHLTLRTLLPLAVMVLTALSATSGQAQEAWVKDKQVSLTLRTGAGTQYRIIGSLTTGDVAKILTRGDGWTKVRTADGKEGWVSAGFLQVSPPARVELERLGREAEELRRQVTALSEKATDLRATKDELESGEEERRIEIDRLTRENYELRAGARWPEWITGAGVVLVGMALGALLGRNAGRRRQPRVRL
jgi:SH3 domain protein